MCWHSLLLDALPYSLGYFVLSHFSLTDFYCCFCFLFLLGMTFKPSVDLLLYDMVTFSCSLFYVLLMVANVISVNPNAYKILLFDNCSFTLVMALQKLKKALGLPPRFGWNGDPCVPQQHPWTGADCRLDKSSSKWVIDGL